jgi:hypothetical protein
MFTRVPLKSRSAEHERMEQKRRESAGPEEGRSDFRDDHGEEPDEDHAVQEGDPFAHIHRMIDAGEEAFHVPPLPGGSGCTDEQDDLFLGT